MDKPHPLVLPLQLLPLIQLLPLLQLTSNPYPLIPLTLTLTTTMTLLLLLMIAPLSTPTSMFHILPYPDRIALCIPTLHYALPLNILTLCTLQLIMTFYDFFALLLSITYPLLTIHFFQFFFYITTLTYSLKIPPFPYG